MTTRVIGAGSARRRWMTSVFERDVAVLAFSLAIAADDATARVCAIGDIGVVAFLTAREVARA